jgi:hypothetical protein
MNTAVVKIRTFKQSKTDIPSLDQATKFMADFSDIIAIEIVFCEKKGYRDPSEQIINIIKKNFPSVKFSDNKDLNLSLPRFFEFTDKAEEAFFMLWSSSGIEVVTNV